ncbi:MAG TPA: metal-dependent hydrolase [Chloroflexota bacterium]|nr:metal-dependent hydrolase [Chloroflexota bacterium]
MPSGPTHALLAAVAYTGVALSLDTPLPDVVSGAVVATLAGLAPDLDCRGSTASRFLGPLTWLLSWVVQSAFGHRGALHSFAALLALCAAVWLWAPAFLLAVAVGYGSHLAADLCTPMRLPALWWPLSSSVRVRRR